MRPQRNPCDVEEVGDGAGAEGCAVRLEELEGH